LIKALGLLLRLYSYLFHLVLSVFLLGLGGISASTRQPLNLRMLPFTQEDVVRGIVVLGAIGFFSTLLALTRVFKYLFPIWAAVVVYLVIHGFFFTAYTFAGVQALHGALWFSLAAIIAFVGALWVLPRRRPGMYI